jgi:hypothetical protein
MDPKVLEEVQKGIQKAEEDLKRLSRDIADAKAAGIDTTEMEKNYADLLTKIMMLKRVYMK